MAVEQPPPAALPFDKYHGLGNDFLVIDARALDLARLRAAAPQLCDRHRGVGGDGLLLLLRSEPRPAMRVINADGSVPEMCGNGLRCFVQWLDDRGALAGSASTVAPHVGQQGNNAQGGPREPRAGDVDGSGLDSADIDTDAGTLRCRMHRDANGRIVEVEVRMGSGNFAPSAIPMDAVAPLINGEFSAAGKTLRGTALSVGNPHLVLFEPAAVADRVRLGPQLERLALFPARVNVEFCTPLSPDPDGTARMGVDVFERGCGWTQACGTGATAAVLAAVKLGRHAVGAPMRVQLPGGWLTITVDTDGIATMRGPTAAVFRGETNLPS